MSQQFIYLVRMSVNYSSYRVPIWLALSQWTIMACSLYSWRVRGLGKYNYLIPNKWTKRLKFLRFKVAYVFGNSYDLWTFLDFSKFFKKNRINNFNKQNWIKNRALNFKTNVKNIFFFFNVETKYQVLISSNI